MTGDPRGRFSWRWLVVGLLFAVSLACLISTVVVVVDRGTGDDPLDKLSSLRDEPSPAPASEREQLLALGRDFVVRFNTYGPDMLDESDHLADYAALTDVMSSKFADVFERNVGYAEQTVVQTGVGRSAEVYAVGVASLDADSAELLVAGTVQFSYPNPKNEDEPILFEPQRVRYRLSAVRVDGEWVVDDLDDIDDGFPSLAEANPSDGNQTDVPSEVPTEQPSDDPSDKESDKKSDKKSKKGEQQ